MSLLYADENLSCAYYRKEFPLIKKYTLKEKEFLTEISPNDSLLCFLKRGTLELSIDDLENQIIKEKSYFLITSLSNYNLTALTDVEAIIVSFKVQVNLCENFSILQLSEFKAEDQDDKFAIIPFNEPLSAFLTLMGYYLDDEIYCHKLQELKREELFILLKAYYPKEVLAKLFSPILEGEDLFFKDLVFKHCLDVRNVQEFANVTNYSTSGFIKKFTRCFGEAPYKWMSNHKADCILYDINGNEKSLKEISEKYNFSSMPHFVNFCKKKYGHPPGQIRKLKRSKGENKYI